MKTTEATGTVASVLEHLRAAARAGGRGVFGSGMETDGSALGSAGAGGSVSGQQIAEDLGLSRNAVWKAVGLLRKAGYVIDADRKTGYRLVFVPERIDPDRVLSELETGFYHSIQYLSETDSTNEVAKQQAKAGAPEGTVIVADRQLRGRGRRGRTWETPPGQALLFSIVLRPDIPPRKAPLLVFLAAAAVRGALIPFGETFIKWPNDVVTADDRKLCGILVEMDAEHDRVRHCVMGIGLNVAQRRRDFPADLQSGVASVTEMYGTPVSRPALLPTLLDEFARRYEAARQGDFEGVLDELRQHLATLGRPVRVHEPGGAVWNGTAVDVQADGALLVRPVEEHGLTSGAARNRMRSDPVAVYAADVSIRMGDMANETE